MHVMHVIDGLALGGAERMLVDIANCTADRRMRVSVCVTRSTRTMAAELRPEIPLTVLDRRRRFEMSSMRAFARLVRRDQVDVLHVHGRSTFSFLALVKLLFRIRPAILLHDHFGNIELDFSVPAWFRGACGLLDRYVGVCQRLGEWARSAGVPQRRVGVIGNALDLSRFGGGAEGGLRRELGIPPGSLVGIFVAGLRPEKGLHVLLESLGSVAPTRDFRMLVAGGDRDPRYAEECRRLAARSPARERIVFLGERADVPELLRSADFAVMPSLSESGPLVLIEYMASRLPFVATRSGEVGRQAAALGVPGMVPPGDAPAMARALDELMALTDGERRERARQGRQAALLHFDIGQVWPQWQSVYESLARKAA